MNAVVGESGLRLAVPKRSVFITCALQLTLLGSTAEVGWDRCYRQHGWCDHKGITEVKRRGH
jgi:hypothetical protein